MPDDDCGLTQPKSEDNVRTESIKIMSQFLNSQRTYLLPSIY